MACGGSEGAFGAFAASAACDGSGGACGAREAGLGGGGADAFGVASSSASNAASISLSSSTWFSSMISDMESSDSDELSSSDGRSTATRSVAAVRSVRVSAWLTRLGGSARGGCARAPWKPSVARALGTGLGGLETGALPAAALEGGGGPSAGFSGTIGATTTAPPDRGGDEGGACGAVTFGNSSATSIAGRQSVQSARRTRVAGPISPRESAARSSPKGPSRS